MLGLFEQAQWKRQIDYLESILRKPKPQVFSSSVLALSSEESSNRAGIVHSESTNECSQNLRYSTELFLLHIPILHHSVLALVPWKERWDCSHEANPTRSVECEYYFLQYKVRKSISL